MHALKFTWHHIRRSPFQSFAAITILALNFFVFTAFFIISTGLSSVLNYFETKPEITIFLKDGLNQSAITTVQNDLSAYPNVREIKFVSKDRALEIYQEQNKGNPMLLEMVTASILPASFEVSASDPTILARIAQDYSGKKDIIDEIIYQKDVIQSILGWTTIVRQAGIIAVSLLTAVAFLVIFVIIGLKITNRKEEIRISRLLGASKFYVKKPFLLEGLFYGLIGSSIGFLVCSLLFVYLRQTINAFFDPVVFLGDSAKPFLQIFAIEAVVGMLIGYLASWIGVKRYIKY